ncbi:MAG: QueT transporter family protein [Thermovirga sp.]
MKKVSSVSLVRGALVAGVYVALTMLFAPVSFGPVQVRVSEALTLLPWLWFEAVPGLFVGCLISNLMGGFGIIDVIFGSAATLVAALLTAGLPNRYLAAVPPVAVNALVVGGYLSVLLKLPLVPTMLYIGLGQIAACFGLGIPLLSLIERRFKDGG